MGILNENQLDRDKELAKILKMSLEEVQKLPIATPDAIRVYDKEEKPSYNLEQLYTKYEHLNFPAYLRTLMKTSATRRHPELFELLKNTKSKKCLDFGSGVGTHSIALLENGNQVTLLDVIGKLRTFAIKRLCNRSFWLFDIYHTKKPLPDNHYDVVICSDVLEHVEDPLKELDRIRLTLKMDGILHLQVSTMIKPSSGHFPESINKWKQGGASYLKHNFEKEGATIYRRIK